MRRALSLLIRRRENPVQSAHGNVHGLGHIGRRQLRLRAALRETILNTLMQ